MGVIKLSISCDVLSVTGKINKDFGNPFLVSGYSITLPTDGILTKELKSHLKTFMVGRKSQNTEKYAKIILEYLIQPEIYAIQTGPDERWVSIKKMRDQLVVQKRIGRPPKKSTDPIKMIPHGESFRRVLKRLIEVDILEESDNGQLCRINGYALAQTDTKDNEIKFLWEQIYLKKEFRELQGKFLLIYRNWLWELLGVEVVDREFKRRFEEMFGKFPIIHKSPDIYKK
jgi:hypothetical protein